MSDTITLNGVNVSANFMERGSVYTAMYIIPVKKGDKIQISLTATTSAGYDIATAYFMAITK